MKGIRLSHPQDMQTVIDNLISFIQIRFLDLWSHPSCGEWHHHGHFRTIPGKILRHIYI